MKKLSIKLLAFTIIIAILISLLALFLKPQIIKVNYESALTVVSDKAIAQYDQPVLDGKIYNEIDFMNFKVNRVFKGSLHFEDQLIEIKRCGLIDYNGKKVFIGLVSEKAQSDNRSYYLLISENFKYFCLNNRTDGTYTLAPAKTIEEYHRVDELIN